MTHVPHHPCRAAIVVSLVLGAAACRDAPVAVGGSAPIVSDVTSTSNPENVLSWTVTFTSRRADSARVVCLVEGDVQAGTPFHAVQDGADTVVLLAPDFNACDASVQVVGSGGTTLAPLTLAPTGTLPAALHGVHLDITGTPSPGYTLLEVSRDTVAFIVAFGPTGDVRWYRQFPLSPGEHAINAAQQTNGDFTVFLGASNGSEPSFGRFLEVRPDGRLVRNWTAPPPYYTDPHELLVDQAGPGPATAHLIGYALRPEDLSAFGGTASQLLAGHTLIRQSGADAVDFLWNTWDHYPLSDWLFVPPQLSAQPIADFDHANSLSVMRDGNYLVSFATLGQIAKIDAVTGRVLWTLGGRSSQFVILSDPLNGFGPQHDVRELSNGDLLLFDNGVLHTPPQSRAVEYRLDTIAMTATMVWEYRHSPPLLAPFVGSARRLANGHTLVGFGALSRVVDVAPDGTVAWEGRLTINGLPAPFFYRATHVVSLYRFEQP